MENCNTTDDKIAGHSIGRPCCGGRMMILSSNGNERESRFVDFREYTGWYCSVNWFFFHVEQHTGNLYHHQTCQAKFDKTRGPIGNLKDKEKILADLKDYLENGTMEPIICTKHTCGCGLCSPKSENKIFYDKVIADHIDTSPFTNN